MNAQHVQSEWLLESAAPMWSARIQDGRGEPEVAAAAIERMVRESNVPASPRLASLVEGGIRALLWSLDENIPVSGPLPGQRSAKTRLAQLRARDIATPSGRRTAGVVELLLLWDVVATELEARCLSSLVVGRDAWDGPNFGSSAVWSPGPAADQAAVGWAVAVDRMMWGDDSRNRRSRIARDVERFRDSLTASAMKSIQP